MLGQVWVPQLCLLRNIEVLSCRNSRSNSRRTLFHYIGHCECPSVIYGIHPSPLRHYTGTSIILTKHYPVVCNYRPSCFIIWWPNRTAHVLIINTHIRLEWLGTVRGRNEWVPTTKQKHRDIKCGTWLCCEYCVVLTWPVLVLYSPTLTVQ